jgi:hypothetical protein
VSLPRCVSVREVHWDGRNVGLSSTFCVGEYQGGGLWLEDPAGTKPGPQPVPPLAQTSLPAGYEKGMTLTGLAPSHTTNERKKTAKASPRSDKKE